MKRVLAVLPDNQQEKLVPNNVSRICWQTVIRLSATAMTTFLLGKSACAEPSAPPADLGKAESVKTLPAPSDIDWPGFLGPRGDANSRETGLIKSWPSTGPQVLWRLSVGSGYAAPAVAQGHMIVFHRVGNDEIIDALEPATGKRYWRTSYASDYRDDFGVGDGPRGAPLIHDGRVYTLGPQGLLHCLDLRRGEVLWKRNLSTEFAVPGSFFGVGTSPVIEGRVLLLNVGGSIAGKPAGIVGLDRRTGETLWTATADRAGYSTPIVIGPADRRRAVFLTRDGVVCLDPATGKVDFAFRYRAVINESVNVATPVAVSDGRLFFSASYGVGGLMIQTDTRGGYQQLWRSENMSNHVSTSLYRDGHLYGFDGRIDGDSELRCVRADNGELVWKRNDIQKGTLIWADGRYWVRSEKRLLITELSPEGCRVLASADGLVGGPAFTPMALSDGRLYLRDERTLVCLDVREKP